MARSGEIYDHAKSGQLRQQERNRIKTELMMMMISLNKYRLTSYHFTNFSSIKRDHGDVKLGIFLFIQKLPWLNEIYLRQCIITSILRKVYVIAEFLTNV